MNEKLESIKHLLTYLYQYRITGQVKINPDDQQLLKRIYKELYKVTPNVGCPACVSHYLHMLESFYDRESKYITPEPIVDDLGQSNTSIEESLVPKKRGRKKV